MKAKRKLLFEDNDGMVDVVSDTIQQKQTLPPSMKGGNYFSKMVKECLGINGEDIYKIRDLIPNIYKFFKLPFADEIRTRTRKTYEIVCSVALIKHYHVPFGMQIYSFDGNSKQKRNPNIDPKDMVFIHEMFMIYPSGETSWVYQLEKSMLGPAVQHAPTTNFYIANNPAGGYIVSNRP